MASQLSVIVQKLHLNVRNDLGVDATTRRQRIQHVIDMVVDEAENLAQAIELDYSGRCQSFTTMTDIVGSLSSLKYARDNLEEWMQDKQTPLMPPYNEMEQLGAKALIQSQPKGVIGIMGTWNCPLYTLLSPMACALAAGNTVVLKPSENTPHTAAAIAQAVTKHLDPNIIAVVTGGVEVSIEFAHQKWDHLVFTGSTATGKKIMAAAAKNLVPVTLELGGKSPAILGSSANIEDAARRLAIAKGNNGGQICISPDTVYVPEAHKDAFIQHYFRNIENQFPTLYGNTDIVPILNASQFARLNAYLEECAALNAETHFSHNLSTYTAPIDLDANHVERRLPFTVVVNPDHELRISQEEIFGPILVLRTYSEIPELITKLAQQDKPLALYFFGTDEDERHQILSQTTSGGMTIDDAMTHAALNNAPFGGVGASGLGHYHGEYGFNEFSHQRSVFIAPEYDFRPEYGLLPPYTETFEAIMQSMVTKD
jgi:coniferyl-aldehyde dehydrogenase